jgi:hypothetical protein
MMAINRMRVGSFEFAIQEASFRYITRSWSGPGWDFSFSGPCINDDPENPVFPYGARLLTEAAPLPLKKAEDFSGIELVLPLPYDEESGEPFFGLNVMEEHEVYDVRLGFAERHKGRYRIGLTATVAKTVLGRPEPLSLSAWAEQLPDHAYPG